MTLPLVLVFVFSCSALLIGICLLLFRLLPAERYRLHDDDNRKVTRKQTLPQLMINSVISPLIIVGGALGFQHVLFYDGHVSVLHIVFESLAILLTYDLLYYWVHRYPFHQWRVLQRVHSLHHAVKEPTVLDAFYIHPVETGIGVVLFMACVWLVGPVHIYAFAAAFFLHSHLNLWIHSGLKLRFFPLRFLSYMANKHNIHHASMRAGNYASITPIPDLLFGTAQ